MEQTASGEQKSRFAPRWLTKFSEFSRDFGRIFFCLIAVICSYIEERSYTPRGIPMRFLPVFLDLAAGPVMLMGSGEAAAAKLRLLRAAGARVRWHVESGASAEAAADGAVEVVAGAPAETADLSEAIAVIAAAGEPHDSVIAARARASRIPVNVVDRPDLSTFIVPAIVDRGEVVVAIGTGGLAPVLARRLRARIEAVLPARIGELASLMGRYRARLAGTLRTYAGRRRFWERVVDGPIGAALLAGRPLEAEAALARAVGDPARHAHARTPIVLVGAGLGDPDLLTLRALNALQDADIIFHDGVGDAVLNCARRDAERVVLGPAAEQQVPAAVRAGRRVVVLTRGDPDPDRFPFLRTAVTPVIVVPGVAAVTIGMPAAQEAA
jgi:uroporphyrin-III C-methyltransferase/precorrin-2 dehydrogenase/sirohydrochlorin ferrochelatase